MIERFIAGLFAKFGTLTIVVGLLLFFYEGVPLINRIWFISKIPYAGWAIEGRVQRYHREQSEIANRLHQQAIDKIAAEQAETEEKAREANLERDTALSEAIEAKRRADEAEGREPDTIMVPQVRSVTVQGQCKKETVNVQPSRRSCLRFMPGSSILRNLR